MERLPVDGQIRKFCAYGFLKNLQFFDPFLIFFFREAGLSFLQIGTLFSLREVVTNIMRSLRVSSPMFSAGGAAWPSVSCAISPVSWCSPSCRGSMPFWGP